VSEVIVAVFGVVHVVVMLGVGTCGDYENTAKCEEKQEEFFHF